jgi:hypothetical protein
MTSGRRNGSQTGTPMDMLSSLELQKLISTSEIRHMMESGSSSSSGRAAPGRVVSGHCHRSRSWAANVRRRLEMIETLTISVCNHNRTE